MKKRRPTHISRLFKSPKRPFPYVGYPHSNNWSVYQQITYKFMMDENEILRKSLAAEQTYGPFVDDYAKAA